MYGLRLMARLLIVCMVLVSFAGCTIRQADLTVVTTRNVELKDVNLNKLKSKRVTGEDSSFVFLFIPFGFPQLEDALDDALDKAGGDLMLDAVIYTSQWWFIIGQNKIKITGTVVNTKEAQ